MWRRGLAARLVGSHLAVIVLGLGIAGAVLLSQARRYFVDADRRSLLVQARVAAQSCGTDCLASRSLAVTVRSEQLPAAANVAQRQTNVRDGVQVEQGLPQQPVAQQQSQVSAAFTSDVRVFRIGDPTAELSRAGRRALEDGRESSATDGDLLIVAAPIRRGKGIIGVVEVRGSLGDVNTVLADLRRQLLFAMAMAGLGALAFGLWRARSIARPLRDLTTATRAIADGRFDQPLPQASGGDELSQLSESFADMRERVKAELALRDAFVADASHELRTPLTAIRGSVEILLDGGAERPEVRDRFLSSLSRETDRLLVLVDGLLQLQSAPRAQARREPVRMDEVVASVAVDLAAMAETAAVSLDVTSEDGPVWVAGDVDQLRQVVMNLLTNAIGHAPAGTAVRVSVNAVGSLCQVNIVDLGPGVPAADRERVFERFVRLDRARARTRGGAGLGLPIARTMAEAHGGTVTLHDGPDGPDGAGTTARVELPLFERWTPRAGEVPTVDDELGAGDVARLVAGEEKHQ